MMFKEFDGWFRDENVNFLSNMARYLGYWIYQAIEKSMVSLPHCIQRNFIV